MKVGGMSGRKCTIALGAALAVAAVVCQGRVYFRWGSARSQVPMDFLGCREACGVPVDINGGRGELTAFSWDADYDMVVTRLKEMYFSGKNSAFTRGGEVSMGVSKEGGAVIRVMAVNLPPRCVVFRLAQTQAEFEKSRAAHAKSFMAGLPAYPDSIPALSVANVESGTAFELSRTRAGGDAVRAFFDTALRGDGWMRVAGTSRGTAMYGKGNDICMLYVAASGKGGETTIGLLHKKEAVGR